MSYVKCEYSKYSCEMQETNYKHRCKMKVPCCECSYLKEYQCYIEGGYKRIKVDETEITIGNKRFWLGDKKPWNGSVIVKKLIIDDRCYIDSQAETKK